VRTGHVILNPQTPNTFPGITNVRNPFLVFFAGYVTERPGVGDETEDYSGKRDDACM